VLKTQIFVTRPQYVKEDEIGGACGTHEMGDKCLHNFDEVT